MNATASWDIEQCLMKPPPRPSPALGIVARQQAQNASPGGTWATVAATATGQNNALVKFHPSDSLRRTISENSDPVNAFDLRVVWAQPWQANRPLPEATKPLANYGALLSVAYSASAQAVCIIFQHAYQAQLFLDDNADCVKNKGFGIYGPTCELLQGHVFPKNDDLRRMEPPMNERRRLTFVRQALFTPVNGLSEELFKKDIFRLVGEANVELVWLFNSGNGEHTGLWTSSELTLYTATVVFSSTSIARMVKDNFRDRSREKSGPYKGIQVSFSHDPCERQLHLVTQLTGANGTVNNSSHHIGANYTPIGPGRRLSNAGNRPVPAVDEDGWQTVQRRK